ncbi:hypothetical protein [Clostridium sp. YIM B02551]|uniref:hypothetical protein n=1 Tax=Clostridium sp. YIM B02551 TaxID=2910679 RepID=UPI001EEBD3D9|nr:hypothetical protein [Clostridium sp. YIM B02551]
MAVIKRNPIVKSSDLIKNEQVTNEEVSIEPRARFREFMKERRMQSEEVKNEEVQEMQEVEKLDNSEEKEVIIDSSQEISKSFNLEMFQPATSKPTSRDNLKAGVMSVINSNCGKRVTLSKDLMDKLNNPTRVAISFSAESIAIGETLPNNNNHLAINPSGKKGAIYSAGIVSEITTKYGLDFSDRTSITFSEVDYIQADGSTIAIINVREVN